MAKKAPAQTAPVETAPAHAAQVTDSPGAFAPGPGPHQQDHADAGHHIIPTSTYYKVFAALMVLLVLTVGAAELNLGPLNVVVAVFIAVVKAVLIILYFMHVRYSSKLVWVFAGAAFVFVFIMFGLTLNDYATRGWSAIPGK
jgi:cytochrome c oxidase subunit 4